MIEVFKDILIIIGAVVTGLVLSNILLKGKTFIDIEKDEKRAEEQILKSKHEAENIKAETVNYVQKRKELLEQIRVKQEDRVSKLEESLNNKELFIKKKEERNQELKLKIASYKEELQSLQLQIDRIYKDILEKLALKTGKEVATLRDEVLEKNKKELESENLEHIAKIEDRLKETADKKAKNIIISVIQRLTTPTSVETRAVTIKLPKDQIKGKIVGKDGVNIKEFEKNLDVDVVFNDLPNTISISAFQLVERRIAELAMEKLVRYKGDINPEIVRQKIKESSKETDDELYEIGKKALQKMGFTHSDKDFIRTVGRLQYRTSYGQNIMKHSMEVSWVASMLGSELGLNLQTCVIGGFLHDLGKAIDQDPNIKDAHDYLSKELMEKYGFSWEEVHAAWTHHDSIAPETPEALIVKAADAVSASRPGARQESMDRYLERMMLLQETAVSFQGVKKAFAISAGRELRAIVDPEVVKDSDLKNLAQEMAKRIEGEITYPGQIKVNVIRKVKHIEIAK